MVSAHYIANTAVLYVITLRNWSVGPSITPYTQQAIIRPAIGKIPVAEIAESGRERAELRSQKVIAGLALIGVLAAGFGERSGILPPLLIWNASASAPIGLYYRYDDQRLSVGDLVLVETPKSVARLAAKRGYLPLGVPLIRRIAARAGATICGHGNAVTIDDRVTLKRQVQDHLGRPLPWWNGCHRLNTGEVFLAMETVPGSFDGRYFGAVPASSIKGHLVALWTR